MSAEDSRPLTVLILNPMGGDGWGGVERWFLDVGLGLRGRGHRVLSVGRPGALWTRRCLEEKFETRATPMRGDLSIGEARAVAYWMQEQRVEVLLTKLHKGIRLGGLSARFAGHVPLVAFMGLVEAKPGWRYRWTYRLFLHWVLTLSPSMRRDILAVGAGIPEERVVAIPYGVVPGDYEVPAARLAVVGTGDLRVDLLSRARDAGVADHVLFAGFRSDVPAVLAAADLFALSSDDEGLPMVVIEAMAAGRAVVATDVGSVRDLVEDGVTGRVVPRRDPAALGDAMADLLLDAKRRQAMGEAGRARVRERYPLDRCIRDTEAFLLRVAGR